MQKLLIKISKTFQEDYLQVFLDSLYIYLRAVSDVLEKAKKVDQSAKGSSESAFVYNL